MYAPVQNYAMAQNVREIPGSMFPGRMIRIRGSTPVGASRFDINLQCGPDFEPDAGIPFHFTVRFDEDCVVRNHLSGEWGPEERGGGLPIVPGQPFEVLFLCEPNSFKVAVNGVHFCEFIHRRPYQSITHVRVDKDVTLTSIDYEGSSSTLPMDSAVISPYVRPIPGGIHPGKMIKVRGSTHPGAVRFDINLQCGPDFEPDAGIPFHFTVRFDEGCVVRNHLSDEWGQEERGGGLPIVPGQPVELLFLCEPNSFKVAVNGVHFCEFVHRLPYQNITHVRVDKDMMLTAIEFM